MWEDQSNERSYQLEPAKAPRIGRLFRLEKFRLVGEQFLSQREPMAPQYAPTAWDKYAAAEFDWNFMGFLFMENRTHLATLKTGQVKTAGWEWYTGLAIGAGVDLVYHHHSQHILDEEEQKGCQRSNCFPVKDSYGLRITVFEDAAARRGLFK